MVQFAKTAYRLLLALSILAGGDSIGDSMNLEVEDIESINLSVLGEQGLATHNGKYDLTVDDTCEYLFRLEFKTHPSDNMSNNADRRNFQGACDPTTGANLHRHNRHWLQFPKYVEETTGFNHMAIIPRPCGLNPEARRQPRYDVNFYRVPAYYRALWTCETVDTPSKCRTNQPNILGRAHFTVPRLNNHASMVPNTPRNFQAHPNFPEAHEYEGVLMSDQSRIPESYDDFRIPDLDISTYDGDFASFRAIIPFQFVSSVNTFRSYWAKPVFEYQNIPLPHLWNVTYSPITKKIELYLNGDAGLCGDEFVQKKQDQEQAA